MQRRRDLAWALALAVAIIALAGTPSDTLRLILVPITVAVSMAAGRLITPLALGLVAFGTAAGLGITLPAVRGDGLSDALSATLLVFAMSVLPWWIGRSWQLRTEQRRREQRTIAADARALERTRIAADLHDSLGHDLALIALQAGALELDPTTGTAQRAAAAELRARAMDATDRLHESVAVLRSEPSPVDRPLPGRGVAADGVAELVRQAERSGMTVRFDRAGVGRSSSTPADTSTPADKPSQPGEWSGSGQQAAFRVVQESLTNAAKYATGPVTVRLDETADPVVVEITSEGRTSGATRAHGMGGRGLTGLDERLRLVGGSLEASHRGAGFVVRATIPRRARAASDASRGSDVDVDETATPHRYRRHLQAAALPIVVSILLVATLFTVHAVTVTRTALSLANYTQLRVGETRAELGALLPRDQQSGPPPILKVPPAPPATQCEFYPARDSILDISQDMYRLCFDGDTLVTKDHLTRRTS